MRKLSELTEPEIDYLHKKANMTEEELKVFDLLVRDNTVISVAMQLNMSERTVYRIQAKINKRIERLTLLLREVKHYDI